MKIYITMNHLDNIVFEEVDLDNPTSVKFECYGQEVSFKFKKNDDTLSVVSSEPLCVSNDGRVNLTDYKKEFSFSLGKGFTLVYPAIDMFTKFDFNY